MAEKFFARLKSWKADFASLFSEPASHPSDTDQHWLRKFAQFWVLVGKGFWRNRCPVRASALAYTTLLALVPLLAVGISISTSLLKREGGKEQIEEFISTFVAKIAPQLDLVSKDPSESGAEKVAENISTYINNVSSGALGATAVLALMFIAISLLSTIEATMNDIWGVNRGRSWFSRVVQYWALITMGPIFLLLAMAPNVGPNLSATQQLLTEAPIIGTALQKFIPLLLLILAFAGFYQLMPNTKVHWQAALCGGVVGGLLWHLNNSFSVVYFGQVARNSQIYGKLAIVPVFLLGMYASWLIVLFGAQVAYAFQNRRAYALERQAENVNQRGREFVALRVMTHIAQRFHRGEPPLSLVQLSDHLCVPSQLLSKVINPLLKTELLLEVATKADDDVALAPARPLDQISYRDILDAIRAGVGRELETREESSRAIVREKFDDILLAERRVADSITLQSLAESASLEEESSDSAEKTPARQNLAGDAPLHV